MTLQEFTEKYGTQGPAVLVGYFIEWAPDFPGSNDLSREIGQMMGDLESVLEENVKARV